MTSGGNGVANSWGTDKKMGCVRARRAAGAGGRRIEEMEGEEMNVRLPDLSFDAAMTSANYEAHGVGFDIYNDMQVYNYWKVLDAARALAANAPPVPSIQATIATFTSASSVLAQLRHGLQTGPGNLSQVWTASIPGASDMLLVLKIIQQSMCHYPPPDESWWANYTNPQDLAGSEAWAYEALQESRDSAFLIYLIITPSGESAWVLVLEYIPGVMLDAVQSISDIQNACIAGLDTVREITCAGFALEDIRAPNFILTGQPDAARIPDMESLAFCAVS
ncbi:hypothetical protein C8J57DRAFT_1219970 [Mycena rebaudengoi]|nr:hypothetical protein C8J57DRAFT_1219970 [Mycena rebaudengoi]